MLNKNTVICEEDKTAYRKELKITDNLKKGLQVQLKIYGKIVTGTLDKIVSTCGQPIWKIDLDDYSESYFADGISIFQSLRFKTPIINFVGKPQPVQKWADLFKSEIQNLAINFLLENFNQELVDSLNEKCNVSFNLDEWKIICFDAQEQ